MDELILMFRCFEQRRTCFVSSLLFQVQHSLVASTFSMTSGIEPRRTALACHRFFLEDAHGSGMRAIASATSQLTHSLAYCDVRADESSSGKFAPTSTSASNCNTQNSTSAKYTSTPKYRRLRLHSVAARRCTFHDLYDPVLPRRCVCHATSLYSSSSTPLCIASRVPLSITEPAAATCVLTTFSTVPAFASRRRDCADSRQKGSHAVRVFSSGRGERMMAVTHRG